MTGRPLTDARRGRWVALAALTMIGATASAAQPVSGLMEDIERNHVIRAGYGLLPPYTQEDSATHRVVGASADVINEIGRQLGVQVVWKRFRFGEEKAAFERGDVDVVGEAVFETMARARDYAFTEPFSFFPICVGVVRRDDRRFATVDQTNRPGTRVAVGAGTTEQEFLQARAPGATAIAVAATPGSTATMALVLSGGADIALVGRRAAEQFAADHPGQVSILWQDNPPGFIPGGFTLKAGDLRGAAFLNAALHNLRASGVLNEIADRYKVGDRYRESAVPQSPKIGVATGS